MTGPAVSQGEQHITLEEMESQLKEAEERIVKPDLGAVTLEGEDVPQDLRGKSAAEALARVKSLEAALQASEQGRQQAMILAQTAAARPAEAPKTPTPEPEALVTIEQVAEAFAEDTAKGVLLMQKMNEQTMARSQQQFASRIEPLIAGTVSTMEAEARRKYPDEFEIYKDEIKGVLDSLPNKNAMNAMSSWDDLIFYVRGRDPLKIVTKMQEKERTKQQADAYETQRQSAGGNISGGSRPPAPVNNGVVIDDTVRDVCRVMGMSEADYAKWARVG